MQKTWSVDEVKQQLARCAGSMERQDGFTAWSFKKELYDVYFYLEGLLEESNFGDIEFKFIKEQKQKKLVKILSSQ